MRVKVNDIVGVEGYGFGQVITIDRGKIPFVEVVLANYKIIRISILEGDELKLQKLKVWHANRSSILSPLQR